MSRVATERGFLSELRQCCNAICLCMLVCVCPHKSNTSCYQLMNVRPHSKHRQNPQIKPQSGKECVPLRLFTWTEFCSATPANQTKDVHSDEHIERALRLRGGRKTKVEQTSVWSCLWAWKSLWHFLIIHAKQAFSVAFSVPVLQFVHHNLFLSQHLASICKGLVWLMLLPDWVGDV